MCKMIPALNRRECLKPCKEPPEYQPVVITSLRFLFRALLITMIKLAEIYGDETGPVQAKSTRRELMTRMQALKSIIISSSA